MRRRRFSQSQPTPVQTGPKRAGIYTRVSTPGQRGREEDDEKLSLPDQEAGCRKLCQEQGIVVDERYVVREVSSGERVHRPLLESLFTAAKRGEIDCIVLYKVNRFARNYDKSLYLYGRAVYELGIEILFVEVPPANRLEKTYIQLKSIFSEDYRAEVYEATQKKRRERVTKRGLILPGAWPLYGYVFDDPVRKRRYLIDEEAAAVVRRMFAMACRGISLAKIARQFNAEGIPTPTAYQKLKGRFPDGRTVGSEWRASNIAQMLHVPSYWGEHAAFREEHTHVSEQNPATGQHEEFHVVRRRQLDEEGVVVQGANVCPPLVEKWQAEMAHQRMTANKKEATKLGQSASTALLRGGYLLCGYCNRPMHCFSRGKGHPQYRCPSGHEKYEGRTVVCKSQLNAVSYLVDEPVWQAIVEYLSDPGWLQRAYERSQEQEMQASTNKQKRLADVLEQLASKEKAADELFAMTTRIDSAAMRERLTKQLNELGAQLEVLHTEQAELEAPSVSKETLSAQRDAARLFAEQALQGGLNASLDDKRMVLYWLGAEVRLWRVDGQLDFELRLTWRGLNAGKPLVLHERECSLLPV